METPQEFTLTWEQAFEVRAFDTQVDKMSHEQAKEMLKLVNKAYVVQRATMLELLKHQWSIDGKLNPRQPEGQG